VIILQYLRNGAGYGHSYDGRLIGTLCTILNDAISIERRSGGLGELIHIVLCVRS